MPNESIFPAARKLLEKSFSTVENVNTHYQRLHFLPPPSTAKPKHEQRKAEGTQLKPNKVIRAIADLDPKSFIRVIKGRTWVEHEVGNSTIKTE